MFRTPSLRNVAARRVFMHNGVFHTLDDVVRFYARRDSNPGEWYPQAADGSPLKYNDLPPPYRSNVDQLPPFGRSPGAPPALSDGDVADIVAFLGTLTDGFRTR
jgi:cytochrome c peroxidase